MADIALELVGSSEFSRYDGWFHGEATDILLATPRDLSGTFDSAARPLTWKVTSENDVVALITVDVDSRHVGHINIVVRQNARRQGIGSETIRLLLNLPEVKKLSGLEAAVEPGNTAGRKILSKNGFSQSGITPEGHLEYHLRSATL